MTIKDCCHTNGFKINDTFEAIAKKIDDNYEHCWSSAGAYGEHDEGGKNEAIE